MRRLIVEEPHSRAAVWSLRTAVFALAAAGVAVGLARFAGIDAGAALTVFAAALTLAFLALLLAGSAGVVVWRTGRRGAGQAALGCCLSLALLAYPVYLTAIALAAQRAELHPFGDDHQCVGAARAGIGIVAIVDVGQFAARRFHADGIVGAHLGAHVQQPGHQRDRRRLARYRRCRA